jgi:hypothetical protein
MSARAGEGETRRRGDKETRRPAVDERCGIGRFEHKRGRWATNIAAAASRNSTSAAGSGMAVSVTWPVV